MPILNHNILVEGAVTIRDLNREFEWNLPDDEDYSTIAGLLLYESQTVPDAGHWIHAENPAGFMDAALAFLTK